MRFIAEHNAIRYVDDKTGATLAEVTFPETVPGVVQIDHTFVDESLRGQGIAGQLLARAANAIEAAGLRAMPTCSYAVHWFAKHPERTELLADAEPPTPGSVQTTSGHRR
jgi:predicted GNAT family acetyltransferase